MGEDDCVDCEDEQHALSIATYGEIKVKQQSAVQIRDGLRAPLEETAALKHFGAAEAADSHFEGFTIFGPSAWLEGTYSKRRPIGQSFDSACRPHGVVRDTWNAVGRRE